MSAEYTPGPWQALGEAMHVVDSGGWDVAMTIDSAPRVGHAERLANTRLIAAAPELLAALVELIDQLEGIGIPEWGGAEGLSLDQAWAAIAKAEDTPADRLAGIVKAMRKSWGPTS